MSSNRPALVGNDSCSESLPPPLPTTQEHSIAGGCQSRPQPRRRQMRCPARDSLYELMYRHAGISLFVRPICWTDLHTELLGVRFQELPRCDAPVPENIPGSPPSRGHMRPSKTITTISDALSDLLSPSSLHPVLSSTAVKTVLQTLWPDALGKSKLLPELHIYFGGRVYPDIVRAQMLWDFPSDTSKSSYSSFKSVSTRPADSFNTPTSSTSSQNVANLPMLCYLGKNQLAAIRKNLFRVVSAPGNAANEPVQRLQHLRAKMLLPADPDHDAHYIGIFLAMAQRHFYTPPKPAARRNSQRSPIRDQSSPVFHDVKVRVLTQDNDTAEFIVYTGYVTAGFLERFHDPCKAPICEENGRLPGIKIEYTRVPVWPILGLRERLGKALGHDMVGEFDEEQIETWNEEEAEAENAEKANSMSKRKREPLAEVLNGSFEEESEDEPVLSNKKRCLSEGPPIGVVM